MNRRIRLMRIDHKRLRNLCRLPRPRECGCELTRQFSGNLAIMHFAAYLSLLIPRQATHAAVLPRHDRLQSSHVTIFHGFLFFIRKKNMSACSARRNKLHCTMSCKSAWRWALRQFTLRLLCGPPHGTGVSPVSMCVFYLTLNYIFLKKTFAHRVCCNFCKKKETSLVAWIF